MCLLCRLMWTPLWINDSKQLCLKVADNGVGNVQLSKSSATEDYHKHSTRFGTNLIQTLSKKLKGKVEVLTVDTGYATLIQFEEYKIVTV
jgi:two-component sensor histidine kinase